MTVALWLLALQGAIGAFDTVYYHEWRAASRLSATHSAMFTAASGSLMRQWESSTAR